MTSLRRGSSVAFFFFLPILFPLGSRARVFKLAAYDSPRSPSVFCPFGSFPVGFPLRRRFPSLEICTVASGKARRPNTFPSDSGFLFENLKFNFIFFRLVFYEFGVWLWIRFMWFLNFTSKIESLVGFILLKYRLSFSYK